MLKLWPFKAKEDKDMVLNISDLLIEKIKDYINSKSRATIKISLDNLSEGEIEKVLKWLDSQNPISKFFGGEYVYIFTFNRKKQLKDVIVFLQKRAIVLQNDDISKEPLFMKSLQEYYKIEDVREIFDELVEYLRSIISNDD